MEQKQDQVANIMRAIKSFPVEIQEETVEEPGDNAEEQVRSV